MSAASEKERIIGRGELFGYGAGGIGIRLIFSVIGSYLTVYLTNAVFLDIAAVSAILTVSIFCDGISDLVVGNIVDRTSTDMGKARIWLLRICVPFAVSSLLLFSVPAFLPSVLKYVYVFVMYNISRTICLTFMQISHYSLVSLMTSDSEEQSMLGIMQSMSKSMGGLLSGALFVRLLELFSGSAENQNTQRGYTLSVLVCCILMTALVLITVFSTRERVSGSDADNNKSKRTFLGLADSLRLILSDKYWRLMIASQSCVFVAAQMTTIGAVYYAMYVLNDMKNVSWIIVTTLAPAVAVLLAAPYFMKSFGKKKVYVLGTGLMVLGTLCFGISAPHKPAMILFNMITSAGIGLNGSMCIGLIAELVSYTRLKTGLFRPGAGNAGISVAEKLGQGIGSALFGILLSIAGFSGTLDAKGLAQPEAVGTAVSFAFIWIPMVLFAAAFVLVQFFFDLDKAVSGLDAVHETR